MSGHSHWATIKRAKTLADQKRGMLFTKLGNAITIAVRQGGPDPELNFKLKLAIENAKKVNMPKETIERAIKRGTGELEEGLKLEEVSYEAFAPGGVALIISSLTSNKNRTVAEIKRILNKYGANLSGPNSVLWMFERKGIIKILNYKDQIKNLEEFELKAIEMGAEDIQETEEELTIYSKPEDLQKVKEALEKENIKIDYAEVEWEAKNKIRIEDKALKEKLDQLFLELEESEEVNDYFTNLE